MHEKIIFHEPDVASLNKKGMMCVDMHYHSKYSDGLLGVNEILAICKNKQIGIAITDHNAAKGSIKSCRQKTIKVITAIEISADNHKEILVYFYDPKELEEFYNRSVRNYRANNIGFNLWATTKSIEEYLDELSKYNCLMSIPHPFAVNPKASHDFFCSNKNLFNKIDAIEAINSSQSNKSNRKSSQWAQECGKAITGGSDAHSTPTIGSTITAAYANNTEEFLDQIRKKRNIVVGGAVPFMRRMMGNWTIIRRNLKLFR